MLALNLYVRRVLHLLLRFESLSLLLSVRDVFLIELYQHFLSKLAPKLAEKVSGSQELLI